MIDIDRLRTWIGKERRILDDLSLGHARAMAALLNCSVLPGAEDPLPPSWHWLYFLDTPTTSSTGSDGHPLKGGFLPPVPLPRRMWAAGTLQVNEPLRLGRQAEKKSTIRSVELKEGKTGPLVFVSIEHALTQGDQLCIVEKQNLVYRDMPAGPAPLPTGEIAPKDADWTKTIVPDPVLLFRYSALTYNAHRIHYDRNYATQEEFYPALVVHGPLLATLLLDLIATQVNAAEVKQFSFRATRPLFDHAPFDVCGKRSNNQVNLWTVDRDGYVGVVADAELA